MMRRRLPLLAFLSLTVLAFGACGDRAEPPPPPAETDATVEGLSPEQIRAQAAEMSPSEAEELGIVDTTIHMENLANPDSLVPLDTTRTIQRIEPPR